MTVSRQLKVTLALGLVLIMSLAACARPAVAPTPTPTPTPTLTPTPTPTPTGPYGELKIALTTFGGEGFYPPITNQTTCQTVNGGLFDYLVRSGGGSDLTPGIADKWELAPDGLSWVFYIHKGIKFHNGEDLTAEDVKFSLDRYMAKEAIYADLRLMIQRVDIVDDYTVRVYTLGAQPYLPQTVLDAYSPSQGIVVPKDYIEKNGIDYFQYHPVGSGPFRFVRNVPGDMVEYEALDKHWRQVPAFKKLTIILIPEETTQVALLKTGAVDVIDVGLESAFELEAAGFRTLRTQNQPISVFFHGAYLPEAAKMPIADIRVRQALSLAINRDELNSTFFRGKAAPPVAGYMPLSATEVDISYWSSYAAKVYRYDLEEAKRLLKEAGYPQGFSIKLWSYVRQGAPYIPRLSEVIQGYWLKAGVKAEIVPTDDGTFARMRSGGVDRAPVPALVGTASMNGGADHPVSPKRLRTGWDTKGSYNFLKGAEFSPEVDRLIAISYSEMDTSKRSKAIADAYQLVTDSFTAVGLGLVPALIAIGPRVDISLPKPPVGGVSQYAEYAKHGNP